MGYICPPPVGSSHEPVGLGGHSPALGNSPAEAARLWLAVGNCSCDGQLLHCFRRIVRDVRLDLPQSAELLRPEFNYPEYITAKYLRLAFLRDRKQIRAGFVDTIYECKEWYKTNGLTLPVRS